MVITAQYAPEKCAVAFVNWNSQEATSQIYSYGSLIDFPDPTEIEGYTFTGWTTPEGEEVKTVEGNLVLVANYEIESYDVSFLDNTKTFEMMKFMITITIENIENNELKSKLKK